MKRPCGGRKGMFRQMFSSPACRIFTSEELFDGSRMLVIKHAGEEYRLQITGNNKLILTK